MKAILRVSVTDWTSVDSGLPAIKKGTVVTITRIKDRPTGYRGRYIANVKIKSQDYTFEIEKSEFEVIN